MVNHPFIPVETESPPNDSIRFVHVIEQIQPKSRLNENKSREPGNNEKDHHRHQNAALELPHPLPAGNRLSKGEFRLRRPFRSGVDLEGTAHPTATFT